MIDVIPAGKRFHTKLDWLDSWHSFSFANHFDPHNTHWGLLLVNNDDTVSPGGGFGEHAHRDMEIVTWVLSGSLEHHDSAGNHGVITPGKAQRMSAGRGIRHSEMNASRAEPVHFLQMWVVPDAEGVEPGYEERDASALLTTGSLVPIASGSNPDAVISFHQRGATMWVARLAVLDEVTVPDAPYVHVFVARGSAAVDGTPMDQGDAARLQSAGTPRLEATSDDTEVVIWETHATIE
jgi:redox-sensitive bicupin YhaK (pirin superfamily)